ncbi:MAG: T9SS type A sorting domain-containing protein [Saprospiraceae bacterium]|nr:T9SS type A sorting domain-containing protein [Saprospiraceae bacterium]
MNKFPLIIPIIKYFGLMLLIISELTSYSQCYVQATVSQDTICAGDSISLSTTGNCGYLMKNGFNNGTIGMGWSSLTVNPVFTNPCGSGPNGYHIWIGPLASIQRTMTTSNYNVSVGNCVINWYMRYGRDQNIGNCNAPDAIYEGVHLQYTINAGASWTDFPGPNILPSGPNSPTPPFITTTPGSGGYWQPVSDSAAQSNHAAYFWHKYSSVIPPVASISNAKFRWAQLCLSTGGHDTWGIDEVEIICPTLNTNILWSTGDTVFNPGTIYLPPHPNNLPYDTCFIITISDSLYSATDTVCVHVNSPVVNLGLDTILKLSHTLTLDAGAGFATYLWNDNSSNQSLQIIASIAGLGTHTYYVDVTDPNGCQGSDTIVVEVIDDTVIDDKYNSNSISLIPNPTKGIFNIVINGIESDFDLQIIDINGKIHRSEKLNGIKNGYVKEINVSMLAKGIYYIKLTNNDIIEMKKLVIQ